MVPTVFIVDDDRSVRDALSVLLQAEGLENKAFASGQDFIASLSAGQTGCVITDVRMPGMDGLSLVRALKGYHEHLPIIVITGHADVTLAVHAMKAGALDFIEKPFESGAILKAVRHALDVAAGYDAQALFRIEIERRRDSLSARETEILTQVVNGLTSREIATLLGISARTVDVHRANIMSKMQASSLAELVRMALSSAR
jgi:two-component system response regulator FixJ